MTKKKSIKDISQSTKSKVRLCEIFNLQLRYKELKDLLNGAQHFMGISLTFMKKHTRRKYFSYLAKSICHQIMTFEMPVYADFQIYTNEGQSHKYCHLSTYVHRTALWNFYTRSLMKLRFIILFHDPKYPK